MQALRERRQVNEAFQERERIKEAKDQAAKTARARNIGAGLGAVVGSLAGPAGIAVGSQVGSTIGGATQGDASPQEVFQSSQSAAGLAQNMQAQEQAGVKAEKNRELNRQFVSPMLQKALREQNRDPLPPDFTEEGQHQESQQIGLLRAIGEGDQPFTQTLGILQALEAPQVRQEKFKQQKELVELKSEAKPKKIFTVFDNKGNPILNTKSKEQAADFVLENPGYQIKEVGKSSTSLRQAQERELRISDNLKKITPDEIISASTTQQIIQATDTNSPFVQIGVRSINRREAANKELELHAASKNFDKIREKSDFRLSKLRLFDEGFLAVTGRLPDERETSSAARFKTPSDARRQGGNDGSRIVIKEIQEELQSAEVDPVDIGQEPSLTDMRNAAGRARLIGTDRGKEYAENIDKRIAAKIKRIEKSVAQAGTPLEKAKFAKSLRKDMVAENKSRRVILDASGRLLAVAGQSSPASDLAFIFNFMKIQDPGSVVRETEFATAASTASLVERAKAKLAKTLTGRLLTEKQKNDFIRQAKNIKKVTETRVAQLNKFYSGIASAAGIDPNTVVLEGTTLGGTAIKNRFFEVDESGTPIFDQEGMIKYQEEHPELLSKRQKLRGAAKPGRRF